jgi:phage gp29-like protein
MAQDLDEYGRPEEVTTKPPRVRLTPNHRDIPSLVTGNLTLERVISFMLSAERGAMRYQQEMFDRMIERDAHLGSCIANRKSELTQAEWKVIPGDETMPKAIDAASLVYDNLSAIEGFDDKVDGLLDGVPKGFAAGENMWSPNWLVEDIIDTPGQIFDWSHPELRVATNAGRSAWEPLIPNKWIIHTPRVRSGLPLRRGLMRTLAVLWCISHYALEDWSSYAEVFGQPIRLGKFPPGAQSDTIDALKTALEQLGSDAYGIMPEGTTIEFLTGAYEKYGAGSNPLQSIIDHCENKMSIALVGHNLNAQSESGSGTLAGNAAADRLRRLARSDAKQLNSTLRRDVFRPLVAYHFGPDVPLPHIVWDLDDPVDQVQRAQVFTISQALGWPLSKSQVAEELGLRQPEGPDDVIEAPQTAPAMFSAHRADLAVSSPAPLSSMQRANQRVARAAADATADERNRVLDLVASLAGRVSTVDELMTRLKLAAPNLDDVLSNAGLSAEELADAVARAMMTADLNGRVALRAEREV